MLISAPRPAERAYSRQNTSGQTPTPVVVDLFESRSNTELPELGAMAKLAIAAKHEVKAAALPADLADAVNAEFGEYGITSMADHRVKTLTGYYVEGLEIPFFDAMGTLGEGWTEQDRPTLPLSAPFTFVRYGENVIQTLSLDQKLGTTTLHTVHNESFISTRHHEIVQGPDGQTVITDERAH